MSQCVAMWILLARLSTPVTFADVFELADAHSDMMDDVLSACLLRSNQWMAGDALQGCTELALELCVLAGLVARQLSWAHSSPYGFRMPSSSRGSTFDSGMYTLHLQQLVRHQSVSLAQAHLPCSEPFTARSCTQSLCYLSSRPTYCMTWQRETRRCQISTLSPSLGGQRVQKLRAPRL